MNCDAPNSRTTTGVSGERPQLSKAKTALFLDFDGTLTEIVDDPEKVHWSTRDTASLNRLNHHLGGAVAVVSGRGLTSLAAHLTGFDGVLCGGHGSEMQGITTDPDMGLQLGSVVGAAEDFAARHDGVWIEPKRMGFTLHFRKNAGVREAARQVLEHAVEDTGKLSLHPAKMAWEVRSAHHSKAAAIETLMETRPFIGRTPVFAGDDTTDFDAFPTVKRLGGLTIAVSRPQCHADLHFDTPAGFRHWLFEDDTTWDG